MPEMDTLLLFIPASLLLGLAPGPDNVFVLTQSMLYGARTGLSITLGLCTGLIVHTTVVVLGIAVIFQTSELAFTIVKFIGASYLLYLSILAFRASGTGISTTKQQQLTLGKLYRRGIIMNISNPKVSIFFLAFLPQFTDPDRGQVSTQLVILGGVFMACALLVFGMISLLAGRLGNWFRHSQRAAKILNRTTGTIFAGLAIKLALSGY